MKLTVLLIFTGLIYSFTSVFSQETKVNIDVNHGTILDVFDQIESQSEYKVFYKVNGMDLEKRVSIKKTNETVKKVLDDILTSVDASYDVVEKIIVIKSNNISKKFSVNGTVLYGGRNPLPGASIQIKGTSIGTVTDINGNFSIKVPDEDVTLVFSFVGYLTEEVMVSGKSNIEVNLIEDIQSLEEVVVIGYGTVKKEDLTGSISVVDAEQLSKVPAPTLANALQGRASGVLVTQNGAAGGNYNVRIRGIGSINKDANPLYVIDGVIGTSINTIAPEDIESLQVLKDASATAIYGANGANGVIIISTKRGKPGKTNVSFSSYASINTIPKQYELMNADQYANFYNEISDANGEMREISYTNDFRKFYYGNGWQEGTNWQDEIIQKAYSQNYYLRVSGGSEQSNYSLSARYFKEQGTLKDNNAESYSMRVNSDFDIGKYIRIGESVNLSRRIIQNSSSNAFSLVLESSPLMKIYNENNKEGYEGSMIPIEYTSDGSTTEVLNTGGNDKFNPLGMIDIPEDYDYRNNVTANIYLEVKPFNWLTFRSEPSIGGNFNRDWYWIPQYDMGVRGTNSASLEESYSESIALSLQNQLTINKSLGNHNFNVVAVQHGRKGWSNSAGVISSGFNYENLNVISQADKTSAVGGYSPWGQLSYLGRLIYDYNSKYLFTASIRRDGTSNFGEENRWGTFPSFSGAWKISEDFFPDARYVDMVKVRAGWGKTGNSEIGSFGYETSITNSDQFHVVIGNRIVPANHEFGKLGNPFIKWESADMTNLGIDIYAINRKIQFSAEFFVKNQSDLLVEVPVSRIYGRLDGDPWDNLAKIQNKGFEIDAQYRKMEGAFNYIITTSLSKVENKVVDIPESIIGTYNITQTGYTIGSLYGYVAEGIVQKDDFDSEGNYLYEVSSDGIVPQPGDLRFKDLDSDGEISNEDRTIIGKTIPDFSYSVNVELFYKNFNFSLVMFGMQNYEVFNQQRTKIESFDTQDMDHNKSLDWVQNHYRDGSPSTEYIRADVNNTNNNTRISSWWVEDASFLRVQDMQIGYNLPDNVLSYVGIKNARVYLCAKNLYTFTGYKGRDPEAPINSSNLLSPGIDINAYPLPRVFSAGVNIDF